MTGRAVGWTIRGSRPIPVLLIALFAASLVTVPASAADEPWHLDDSFGTGGEITTHFGPGFDEVFGVAAQSDGKIVAVGTATAPGPDSDFAVTRYNADGSLDKGFGSSSNGKIVTDFYKSDDTARGVAIAPDGSIVVVGGAGDPANKGFPTASVVIYDKGGLPQWQSQLNQLNLGYSELDAVAVYPPGTGNAGKIIVAGFTRDSTNTKQFLVARLFHDAKVDTTFGNGGYVTLPLVTAGDNVANAVVIQPDSKIVVAGTTDQNSFDVVGQTGLIRLNPNGTIDTGFGGQGTGWAPFTTCTCAGWGVGVDSTGDILVAGQTNSPGGSGQDMAMWRFDAAGTPVSSIRADFFGRNDVARAIVFQRDTYTLVGWTAQTGDGTSTSDAVHFALARFDLAGDIPDTSFGDNNTNKLTAAFAFGYDAALAATVAPDGDIVAAGGSNQAAPGQQDLDFALARFTGPGNAPPGDFEVNVHPLPAFELRAKPQTFPVSWAAVKPPAKPVTFDLRTRSIRYYETTFGSWQTVLTRTTETTKQLSLIPGTTMCVEARAHSGPSTSPWSDPQCTATPVDDRTLDRSSSEWGSYTRPGCYRGTYIGTAHGHGAEAHLVAVFKRLAVVVAEGPGFGEVQVIVNGIAVKTISLQSSAIHCGVLVPVKTFAVSAKREIDIKHVANDKGVFVDGVGVNFSG